MAKYKINNNVSIQHTDNKELLQKAMNKGILGIGRANENLKLSNAAPYITTPNINVPFGALTYIRPKAIEILTAPRMADKLASPQKNGVWGDEAINISKKEYTGKTTPDDGTSNNAIEVKTNYDNTMRGIYYYTTHWYSNDIQETRAGAFNDNYRSSQVEAAMKTIAIDRNKFFFRGIAYKGQKTPIFGLLNDENLLDYTTIEPGAGGSGYWDAKTPEEIKNDIVAAYQKLINQSNSIVEAELENGRVILAVAGGCIGQLARVNQYGLTARALLKQEYGDKLEILSIPEFNSAHDNSDVFYLIFLPNSGEPTMLNSYVEMSRAYPIFVKDSEVSQKISAATSGCIVQFPMFIVRYSGIGKTAAGK